MNKKIIFIINDLHFGGHVKSFLTQISSIIKNQNDYKIIASDKGYLQRNISTYKFVNENNIQYYNANKIRTLNFSLELIKQIRYYIKEEEDIILHVYSPECYFSAAIVKVLCKNISLIASTMGGVYAFPFYKSADLHIAVSHEQLAKCDRANNNHILIANRIHVDPIYFHNEKYEHILKRRNIYLISRLDYDKSIPLINSIEILKKLSKRYNIFILGDGEYKKEFKKLLINSNINANFEGMVDNPLKYVESCALVLGMGRSIIEFILSGYPAILVGYDGSIDLFSKKNIEKAFLTNFSGREIFNSFNFNKLDENDLKKSDILEFMNYQYNIEFFERKFSSILNDLKGKKTSFIEVFSEYINYNLLRLINIIKRKINDKNK
jgi:hypothetical protein